ncbi:hypothetical protein AC244_15915 [Ensifer adhaerens]|uniref:Uncharacterized protein n=1 Tax=Ensifer adhaerens TaxID=106592 RepID=A0A0L8BT18_ENSAD|nr:hypothetical protein [Ensifer adhaerens]KOF17857.1 hypothetical protein AC244_15915 [Ensifer adhaerens]
MTEPQPSPSQRRLDAIRNRLSQASKEWSISADAEGTHLLAGNNGQETIAIIPKAANLDDTELALRAPEDLRWTIELYGKLATRLRAAERELLRLRSHQNDPKNYAAECAMKCKEPAFKKFLEERHGLERPLTDERVNTRVRSLLKVSSRSKLNEDAAAAARWRDLRDEFDAWRRNG